MLELQELLLDVGVFQLAFGQQRNVKRGTIERRLAPAQYLRRSPSLETSKFNTVAAPFGAPSEYIERFTCAQTSASHGSQVSQSPLQIEEYTAMHSIFKPFHGTTIKVRSKPKIVGTCLFAMRKCNRLQCLATAERM